MLVLSRRHLEKIALPSLGITVQVLQINANQVRLGIDAPPSVSIMRAELDKGQIKSAARRRHSVANLVNKLSLAVHVLDRQLQLDRMEQAVATVAQLKEMLE